MEALYVCHTIAVHEYVSDIIVHGRYVVIGDKNFITHFTGDRLRNPYIRRCQRARNENPVRLHVFSNQGVQHSAVAPARKIDRVWAGREHRGVSGKKGLDAEGVVLRLTGRPRGSKDGDPLVGQPQLLVAREEVNAANGCASGEDAVLQNEFDNGRGVDVFWIVATFHQQC